ncbi:MAG: STAS domain-containing protein, partial [Streptosporangiaceae bacterium]
GDLDILTAPVLDDMLALALSKKQGGIVLDLSSVEFLDCAALDVIARAAEARRARGAWLTIRHPGPIASRLLWLTGVVATVRMDPASAAGRPAETHDVRTAGKGPVGRKVVMAVKDQDIVAVLLEQHGYSYAQEAGIRLADKPAPLYQLLVLATLLSARISGEIAVAAARELFQAGYRTPKAMRKASWLDRVDALGRGHYKRYDESTATMLGNGAELLIERWHGDVRRLHEEGGDDTGRLASLLTEFPGIGPAGASIFLREVQGTWTGIAPYLDRKVLDGARKLGLAEREIAKLADGKTVELASALIRVALSKRAAGEIRSAAGD